MSVPGPPQVQVVWARPGADPALLALLADAERAALARLQRSADRARYVAAHALLRLVLADRRQVPVADIEVAVHCARCGSDQHGKPFVTGGADEFSLSHAGDRVVVAVGDAPLGIDVELLTAVGFAGFDAVALAPDEPVPASDRARAVLWTRKEAVLKATGLGLTTDPTTLRVSAADRSPRLLAWPGGPVAPGDVRLYDLDLGPGHAAALAVVDPTPRAVTVTDGSRLLSGPAAAAGRPRRSTR